MILLQLATYCCLSRESVRRYCGTFSCFGASEKPSERWFPETLVLDLFAMLPNSTRDRVDVDQRHSPAYRVSHHVGGAALALRGVAIPHGQHNVGEVHNTPACHKVSVLIRPRGVEHFDGRLPSQCTISRHMLG